jgi:protein-tyrosine phosphatase
MTLIYLIPNIKTKAEDDFNTLLSEWKGENSNISEYNDKVKLILLNRATACPRLGVMFVTFVKGSESFHFRVSTHPLIAYDWSGTFTASNTAGAIIGHDGLYVGGEEWNERFLQEHRITHILSMNETKLKPFLLPENLQWHKSPVQDWSDVPIIRTFDANVELIGNVLQAKGRILVHCVAGMSRSTTTICAYLIKEQGLTPVAALALVKQSRTYSDPNRGFINQLYRYGRKMVNNQHAPHVHTLRDCEFILNGGSESTDLVR